MGKETYDDDSVVIDEPELKKEVDDDILKIQKDTERRIKDLQLKKAKESSRMDEEKEDFFIQKAITEATEACRRVDRSYSSVMALCVVFGLITAGLIWAGIRKWPFLVFVGAVAVMAVLFIFIVKTVRTVRRRKYIERCLTNCIEGSSESRKRAYATLIKIGVKVSDGSADIMNRDFDPGEFFDKDAKKPVEDEEMFMPDLDLKPSESEEDE